MSKNKRMFGPDGHYAKQTAAMWDDRIKQHMSYTKLAEKYGFADYTGPRKRFERHGYPYKEYALEWGKVINTQTRKVHVRLDADEYEEVLKFAKEHNTTAASAVKTFVTWGLEGVR